jgi:signal transduction histidine kinase
MRFEATCDPDAQEIFADRDRVEQIFVNLIGNAAKYTPSGGLIRVAARLKGADILASVTDSGPGIPESEREKIFDAFYRTRDAVNMKTPGTGLGLTITKALVKLMGGQVWVESPESGKGTTFVFSLPKDGKTA